MTVLKGCVSNRNTGLSRWCGVFNAVELAHPPHIGRVDEEEYGAFGGRGAQNVTVESVVCAATSAKRAATQRVGNTAYI